jgi:hypothetical protein
MIAAGNRVDFRMSRSQLGIKRIDPRMWHHAARIAITESDVQFSGLFVVDSLLRIPHSEVTTHGFLSYEQLMSVTTGCRTLRFVTVRILTSIRRAPRPAQHVTGRCRFLRSRFTPRPQAMRTDALAFLVLLPRTVPNCRPLARAVRCATSDRPAAVPQHRQPAYQWLRI